MTEATGLFPSRSIPSTAPMILSLCFLLLALSPSRQEICSAPGALHAPILYLSRTSARPGVSVWFQCSVFSQVPATRVAFCKDGEEVSSQRGLQEKITYDYVHRVSRGSSGNYSCGYEIKDGDNWVTRSQLSPAQHLNVTGSANSSGGTEEPTRTGIASSSRGAEEPTRTGPAMSPVVWAVRCTLVLLLLVSAPVITFLLEKRGLPEPAELEEILGGSSSILERRGAGSGGTPLKSHGRGGDTNDQL